MHTIHNKETKDEEIDWNDATLIDKILNAPSMADSSKIGNHIKINTIDNQGNQKED